LQRPSSLSEELVGPQLDAEIDEVGVRLMRDVGADHASQLLPSQDVGRFEGCEMWCGDRGAGEPVGRAHAPSGPASISSATKADASHTTRSVISFVHELRP